VNVEDWIVQRSGSNYEIWIGGREFVCKARKSYAELICKAVNARLRKRKVDQKRHEERRRLAKNGAAPSAQA